MGRARYQLGYCAHRGDPRAARRRAMATEENPRRVTQWPAGEIHLR